jgi:glycerate kinase
LSYPRFLAKFVTSNGTMKHIIVAIDSFKGSVTSSEAAAAVAEGIREALPNCTVDCLPVADGGEGMLDAVLSALHGELINISVHGVHMEAREACYGVVNNGGERTAFIEIARLCGLTLLPEAGRNPLYTTSYAVGEAISDALNRGCRHIVIGLGGSATNDAGLGALQALGFRFIAPQGTIIPIGMGGRELWQVAKIDRTEVHPAVSESKFTALCDVSTPFCGSNGAVAVFAGQKGAGEADKLLLEQGMTHLAELLSEHTGTDVSHLPMSGAAGGMGGGFFALLHAELKAGIPALLDLFHFDERLKGADLLITGEGKADCQTLLGKAPMGILQAARKQNVPVLLMAGRVEDADALKAAGFHTVCTIHPEGLTPAQEMNARQTLTDLKETTIQQLQSILNNPDNKDERDRKKCTDCTTKEE